MAEARVHPVRMEGEPELVHRSLEELERAAEEPA